VNILITVPPNPMKQRLSWSKGTIKFEFQIPVFRRFPKMKISSGVVTASDHMTFNWDSGNLILNLHVL
jgi:hypothetical protein